MFVYFNNWLWWMREITNNKKKMTKYNINIFFITSFIVFLIVNPGKKKDEEKRFVFNLSKKKTIFFVKFIKVFFVLLIVFLIISNLSFLFLKEEIKIDSDNDGFLDSEDFFPKRNVSVRFTVISFKVADNVLLDNNSKIFFRGLELFNYDYGNHTYDSRSDFNYSKKFDIEKLTQENKISMDFEVADNIDTHTLIIQFFLYNESSKTSASLDIDNDKGSRALVVDYDIVNGFWTGDDEDGITDGSYDGNTNEMDCRLEYSFENY